MIGTNSNSDSASQSSAVAPEPYTANTSLL